VGRDLFRLFQAVIAIGFWGAHGVDIFSRLMLVYDCRKLWLASSLLKNNADAVPPAHMLFWQRRSFCSDGREVFGSCAWGFSFGHKMT